MPAPPASVLSAFGVHGCNPASLDGGQGTSWAAGGAVLKPLDVGAEEAHFIACLQGALAEDTSTDFRVARPMKHTHASSSLTPTFPPITPASSSSYIFEGWTASTLLPDLDASRQTWRARFAAAQALHRSLAKLYGASLGPPAFLAARTHRWSRGDRLVWGDVAVSESELARHGVVVLPALRPALHRLIRLQMPLPPQKRQLVHGDLHGNTLFAADPALPPAIIDFSLYWRSALGAEAMIAADGLIDDGEGVELVEEFGVTEERRQALVRCLLFRLVVRCIAADPHATPEEQESAREPPDDELGAALNAAVDVVESVQWNMAA